MGAWLRWTFELQDPRHARLLPMEGLRGVAVTLVFLQHFGVQAQLLGMAPGIAANAAAGFRAYGNLGVELFFVLSGFLIYGTLVRRAPAFWSFMLRRAQRIYPAFLAVFVLALAVNVVMPGEGKIPAGAAPAAAYLVENLLLLPGLFPVVPLFSVAWSLSYEAFFYLVTAAGVLGFGLHRVARGRRVAGLWALSAGFVVLCAAGIPEFPARMMPFFAGMLLAEGAGERVPGWLGWAGPLGVLALCVSLLVRDQVAVELCWTVAFFALCAVCFRGAGAVSAWMVWTPLRWLGNMSYSYYLLHGFVVRVVMVGTRRVLERGAPGAGLPEWLFWALLPVVFGATLATSAMLFVLVEKPLSLRPAGGKVGEAAA